MNLTPSDEPRDIYAHVAQRITERLLDLTMTGTVAEKTMAKHWLEYVGPDGYFPRGFAKQPVMILPYGGTHDGYKKALLSWFTKNAPDALVQDMRNRRVLINFLARQVRLTTEEAVSTSVGVMRWVKDCARAVAKTGNAVEWVAPSGFLVRQLYTSEQYKQVQIKMRGRRMRVLEVSQGEEIDVSAQSRRAPPNFIHSLDAAALVLAVESAKLRGISHIMAVHDCVGTHAADMGHLNVALREGFMRIYQRNVLMDFKAACIKAMGNTFAAAGRLEDPPRLGDLDLEQVRYAPYFFA